ncbi:MAG: hypothetical protein KBD01_10280 [Acidobacteria bacterium]|nr:hypothetical protein [Acidobacteriota bacterium]
MSARDRRPATDTEEPPPLLGRWRNVYLLVAGELALLVLLFWLLRRWAS